MIRELNGEAQPEQPQRRVWDCDTVEAGRLGPSLQAEPLDLREIALAGPFRREALVRTNKRSADRRSLVRPLSALLILELGLLGVLYVSKRYTDPPVIVVPATTNERSVIT
jgi:hypothetical protein